MRFFFGILVLASLALVASCAPRPYGPPIVSGEVVVETAPPPAQVEAVPVAPYQGAVWIEGRWHWNGVRYVWVRGYYERPRPGWVWVPHRWYRGPRGHWHYVPGHWRRV